MASKSSLCRQDCMGGVSSSISGPAVSTGAGGRRGTDTSRVSSVSSQFSDGPQHSPSSTHSSTPSWSEEPAQSNMDISTGHMILVSEKQSAWRVNVLQIGEICSLFMKYLFLVSYLFLRRIWRITCVIRTVSRRSGRLCVPIRRNPVQ